MGKDDSLAHKHSWNQVEGVLEEVASRDGRDVTKCKELFFKENQSSCYTGYDISCSHRDEIVNNDCLTNVFNFLWKITTIR